MKRTLADRKLSVQNAIAKSLSKELGSGRSKSKKPYSKPEKETQSEVCKWLEQMGFPFNIIESKAVYSKSAGRYLKGQTDPGVSDIIGCDNFGRALFIELKAKTKRNNLSIVQHEFLAERIKSDAFAVSVDSAEILREFYDSWCDKSGLEAREYLISILPRPRDSRGYDPFDDTLSFDE